MDTKMVYEIYGRRYTFIKVHIEEGYIRGYHSKKKKWAWLFDGYLQFDGEDIVPANRVK